MKDKLRPEGKARDLFDSGRFPGRRRQSLEALAAPGRAGAQSYPHGWVHLAAHDRWTPCIIVFCQPTSATSAVLRISYRITHLRGNTRVLAGP